MTTTAADLQSFCTSGSWRTLAERAEGYLHIAQRHYPYPISWALGGGTRLMLEFQHRISDDIDIFISEDNVFRLLSPVTQDHIAEEVTKYDVDHSAIKLYFGGVGEIDFIFCPSLIGGETSSSSHYPSLPLEPVSEVFAKKLYHRGSRITPRDVFDWWFVGTNRPEALDDAALANVLRDKLDGIEAELNRLIRVIDDPAVLISPAAAWAAIRSPYKPDQADALRWALTYIDHLKGLSAAPTLAP